MRTFALALSLLWRTVAIYVLLSVPAVSLLLLLSAIGFDFQPNEESQLEVTFIKGKPTLFYGALAVALVFCEYLLRINLHRSLWGRKLQLTERAWRTITLGVSALLLALAVLNAMVAIFASVDVWVAYKLYGALTILALGHFAVARYCCR